MKLQNYICGDWVEGQGQGAALTNPVNGEVLAYAGSEGVDLGAALAYARDQGRSGLQALNYGERAQLLESMAQVLQENREKYYQIAYQNSGNTKVDAAIDVDGGIGTLKYYAVMGKTLGDAHFLCEPGTDRLAKDKAFQALHILTPLTGVAIHINAFNFPSWGLWEKAAGSLLAGVPVFAKPATATSLLTQTMIRDLVNADILPNGSLSIICGGGHDLMDYVQTGDVVLFTGSADTAQKLRTHPRVIETGIRFNVEADSLNMALLAEDVTTDSPLFEAFVKEVAKEMTTKAGQKCTAIRRILVPAASIDAVADALTARLAKTVIGDPASDGVRMGPLVNRAQQQAAWEGIDILSREAEIIFGGDRQFAVQGGDVDSGCFVQPTLLRCNKPMNAERIHDTEVFGPVATLMPYSDEASIWALASFGGGSLAGSVFTNDEGFFARAAVTLAAHHGRLLMVDETVMNGHTGHGIAMPQCVHGGPGRAGGGEELGGLRGLRIYHQRTAIQANISQLENLRAATVDFSS
ncbi:3,4-dehydroadipyl-CoA semialdehyde dehydrogenase [Pseudomaricurvus alkylphenolicus]|uniref:3,4-dehydroadipyl-CoA semialdehyde dehydrogenase n=1 Tax=Pseudomaricurvus alkylphenolicus TaxID=1306991 RepID=UPI00197CC21E|nr:3,4-dehydroadipyl-CoA semialdehyde dehydrogenase [Pseudomaricurvus alkylphenolicus]